MFLLFSKRPIGLKQFLFPLNVSVFVIAYVDKIAGASFLITKICESIFVP